MEKTLSQQLTEAKAKSYDILAMKQNLENQLSQNENQVRLLQQKIAQEAQQKGPVDTATGAVAKDAKPITKKTNSK